MSKPEPPPPGARIDEAMIADLRPQAGARFVLLRDVCDAKQARYVAAIITPEATWRFGLVLAAGTETPPVIAAADAMPPPAMAQLDMLTKLAQLAARAAPTRASDGLTPWPPRIVRWRGPGR